MHEAPPEPRPSRRRLSPALLVAVAFVALLSALVIGFVDAHGKSAKSPTLPAGAMVAIQPVTTAAAAQRLTQRLNSAGVHVRVTTQPATPALVGTWISEGATPAVPPALVKSVAQQAEGYSSVIRIPAHFKGQITLEVGVPPRPGQKIEVAGLRNALAPGMPLGCRSLSGAAPADAIRVFSELGYTVDAWSTRDSATSGVLTATQIMGDSHLRVAQVFVHDWSGTDLTAVRAGQQRHLIVKLVDDRSPSYLTQLWTGFAPALRTANPPALAGC